MKKGYPFFLLLTGMLISFNTLFAQGTGPAPCGDPDDPMYDPNNCPIDTGVVLLAIFALWMAYRYLNKQKYPSVFNNIKGPF